VSVAPTRDRPWTGRTGPSSRPSSGVCRQRCVAIAWAPRTRSCAGIAALSADDGPIPTGLGGLGGGGGALGARRGAWGLACHEGLGPAIDDTRRRVSDVSGGLSVQAAVWPVL